MANWSNPILTSLYTDVLTELKNRDVDLALQFDGTSTTNLPTGAIRWNSTISRWQKWNGSSWGELTAAYAFNALSTSGNASIGGTLTVTGATALNGGGTTTTPATADNSTKIATTAFVKAQNYAPSTSPVFTGTPTAPTAALGDSTTLLATTAFVVNEISSKAPTKTGGGASGTWGINITGTSAGVSSGPVNASTGSFTGDVTLSGTGQLKVPSGTTGERSGTPSAGMIRYNTTLGQFEGYNGSAWGQIGGGATGAGFSGAVSFSSGAISYTGIPSTARRFRMVGVGLSNSSGNGFFGVRVGNSGGFLDTGYSGGTVRFGTSGASATTETSYIRITQNSPLAADSYTYILDWVLVDSATNLWTVTGQSFTPGALNAWANIIGYVAVSGLDRVQFYATLSNFDGGTMYVTWD